MFNVLMDLQLFLLNLTLLCKMNDGESKNMHQEDKDPDAWSVVVLSKATN